MNPLSWLRKHLEEGDPDLLRSMLGAFAEQLMAAEASALCNAGYGEVTPERVNSRNGYRTRDFDTRVGTIELAIPKLRTGSYFPDWLVEPRRRAERALVAVIAQCYVEGVSTRRVDDVVKAMGIDGISKSQVSELAKSLDAMVSAFRNRPLDGGPYSYIWLDALTQKVREGGRIVNVAVIVATGVNADGTERSSVSTSSPPRTGRAGQPFCAVSWPGGCREWPWWSPTHIGDWSTPSPRCSPVPRGNGAGRTSCATS